MMGRLRVFCIFVGFCVLVYVAKFAIAEIPIQQDDAQILGVLSVMDENEIKAAHLAEKKNVNSQVLDYARMIDIGHNLHLEQTRQFSQKLGLAMTDNASLDRLREQEEHELAALNPLNGLAFEQLYIADMIKAHSEALNWIEKQDTQDLHVREFLQETRKDMIMHLKKAQDIQGQQKIGQT